MLPCGIVKNTLSRHRSGLTRPRRGEAGNRRFGSGEISYFTTSEKVSRTDALVWGDIRHVEANLLEFGILKVRRRIFILHKQAPSWGLGGPPERKRAN